MKTIVTILLSIFFAGNSIKAQNVGDFISCHFTAPAKPYYARVLSVENDIIQVTFVHSNSIYKFTKGSFYKDLGSSRNNAYLGSVISNIGGIYGEGTPIYYCVMNRKEPITTLNRCVSRVAILEFNDGKQYVAKTEMVNQSVNEYTILHTGKIYNVDVNTRKILSSDGTYNKGTFLKKMTCTNYSNIPESANVINE